MDSLEIIRQLQQDAALRAEMRAVLLGEELLRLPELVQENSKQIAALTDRMDQFAQRMNQLADRMDQLTDRMDQLAERMDQFAQRMDQLAERMDQFAQRMNQLADRMDQLTQRMDQLADIVRHHDSRLVRVEDRLGNIIGVITEERYRRSFASRVARIEGRMRVTKILSPQEVDDISYEASQLGLISDDEACQLLRADVVAFGTERASGEEVILVAEVAHRVHVDGIIRAIERSKIAARVVSNRRAIPVVMGSEAEGIRDRAYSGVWLVENYEARPLVGEIS